MIPHWLRHLLPRRYHAEQEIRVLDHRARERDKILDQLQRQYEERYGHLS